MGASLIVQAKGRRLVPLFQAASALCLAASVVLFVLHFSGASQSSAKTARSAQPASVPEPVRAIVRVGDPDSVFDPSRYDENFPKIKEWVKAGVAGGIPPRRDRPPTVDVRLGDDIQKAIDSAAEKGGVVQLDSGTFKLSKSLNLKSNVILRGNGVESTVLEMPLAAKKGDDFCALKLYNIRRAGLEDFTLRFPAEWDLQAIKMNMNFGIALQLSEDCWVDNCRIAYCDSFALSVSRCKRVTLRDILVRGAVNRTGSAFNFSVIDNQGVLGTNLAVFDTRYFSLGWNKNSVFLNCYLHKDVLIECKPEELEETLLEGFDKYHSAAPKYRRPEPRHGTYYPVTGMAKSADQLEQLYGKNYIERSPGDF